MIAKNLPTGSYAAGCPARDCGDRDYDGGRSPYPVSGCVACERSFYTGCVGGINSTNTILIF